MSEFKEEIKTKYGANVSHDVMAQYFIRLTDEIFKLLPMHKDDRNYDEDSQAWETLDTYLYSLLQEIAGGNELILNDKYFVKLLANLESLPELKCDYQRYRSHIFKCTNICQQIVENLNKGGE